MKRKLLGILVQILAGILTLAVIGYCDAMFYSAGQEISDDLFLRARIEAQESSERAEMLREMRRLNEHLSKLESESQESEP